MILMIIVVILVLFEASIIFYLFRKIEEDVYHLRWHELRKIMKKK